MGGGGLIAGITAAVKHLKPEVKIIVSIMYLSYNLFYCILTFLYSYNSTKIKFNNNIILINILGLFSYSFNYMRKIDVSYEVKSAHFQICDSTNF